MTTSVTIKTRGLGASGTCAGESFKMGPNIERTFHTEDTLSLSLTQETHDQAAAREAEAVPGSAENDGLIEEVDPSKLAKLSGNEKPAAPKGNETGATETAQRSEPPNDSGRMGR